MINLARLRPGDVVVDPFCGIGTILQEALLAGVRVKGLDIDAACVNMTVENLSWISRRFNLGLTKSNLETGIKVGDARELEKHLPKRSMHAVVTEPELGPPLQRLPTRGEAQQIISKAEKLYSRFLASAATILRDDGRIVLTFPVLRLQEGGFLRIRDTARMLEDAGLTLAGGPFQVRASESELHYSKTRMMEREICVLEKSC